MENYFLLLWKSSLNLLELEQKVGHSWASNSQNRLPNKVRREWPENMVKTSQWRVTQWRDLWLIGQSFSVLESVFIPSDDQIPAWEEQTTSLPMCIGQGPWDPRRPPCRHEPGEQIKKSPWLSSRFPESRPEAGRLSRWPRPQQAAPSQALDAGRLDLQTR